MGLIRSGIALGGGGGLQPPDASGVRRVSNLGSPDVTLSFGTWREVSSDVPSLVVGLVVAETDGNTTAAINSDIDYDGDGSADLSGVLGSVASSDQGSSVSESGLFCMMLPPGGQYKMNNVGDPNGTNSFSLLEVELG